MDAAKKAGERKMLVGARCDRLSNAGGRPPNDTGVQRRAAFGASAATTGWASLKINVHRKDEVDRHGLAVQRSRLVAPLFDGFHDCRVYFVVCGLKNSNILDAAVHVDDALEHERAGQAQFSVPLVVGRDTMNELRWKDVAADSIDDRGRRRGSS